MADNFTSPVGRFVQGDAFEAQTKDQQGNPMVVKTGPNAGQPTKRWFMAVAYSKADPATLPYLQKLAEIARAAWPAFFTAYNPSSPPLFGCSHPRFSIKITDGDGVDDNGKPNSAKPGFAGCWVVKYSSSFQAPEVYNVGQYDPMQRVTDPRALQRGYRVRIFASAENNNNDQRPGLYVNLNKVEISAIDEVIQTGPTAEQAFGSTAGGSHTAHATTAPAMATATPPVPGAPATPVGIVANPGIDLAAYRAAGWTDDMLVEHGHATRPAPAVAPIPPSAATPPPVPAAPTPPVSPPAPPVATPSPSSYTGYIPDVGGAPQGFKMTPAAQGATYQALMTGGWSHEMMLQHGMIAPQ